MEIPDDRERYLHHQRYRTCHRLPSRSPGVFFDHDRGKTHAPASCFVLRADHSLPRSWLTSSSIRRTACSSVSTIAAKLPASVLLRALGYSTEEILNAFYATNVFHIKGETLNLELVLQRLRGVKSRASTSRMAAAG